MSYRPYQHIERRKSRQVHVGRVAVGGDAPISVQTMTNTLTTDVAGTIAQIRRSELAGVDIVRVSCPDQESALALAQIVPEVNVPIVADIHFHYRRAIEAAQSGAACLRINPGNIGSAERVRDVIKAARDHNCSMRIGVNAGSLERHLLEKYGEPNPEALVESALEHAKILQDHDFHDFKISVKASDVFLAVAAYQQLAEHCDHPLHIGITEAGGKRTGTVKSSIGLGSLLWAGIGDTIRVSLSAEPEEEVLVGWEMLKSLGLRHRGVKIISCPSCARQGFNVIDTVAKLEERLAHIQTPITLSIIGCVVNGPGEALMTDIGLTGGGSGRHMIYHAGKTDHTIDSAGMVNHIVDLVEAKAEALSRISGTSRRIMSAPQAVRGTRDLIGEEQRRHQFVVDKARQIAATYGFDEWATPIFEPTTVFARSLGDTSDVVTKEMYTFEDRGGDSITLRPEGTAGVCRALVNNGLTQSLPQKVFYAGPMFRYERPQKGRYRQFHQIGLELIGPSEPLADAEVIACGWAVLQALGVSAAAVLELNTLGDKASRTAYRQALVAYFVEHRDTLSADSLARLERNPLRILDSKDEGDRRLVAEAPTILPFLTETAASFYKELQTHLHRFGVPFRENPRIVRGAWTITITRRLSLSPMHWALRGPSWGAAVMMG